MFPARVVVQDMELLDATVEAAELWNAALAREVYFVELGGPVEEGSCDDAAVRLARPGEVPEKAAAVSFMSKRGDCLRLVKVKPNAASSALLIAHELGHLLDLEHSDEPGSVMEKCVSDGAHVTARDARMALEFVEEMSQ